MFPFARPLRAVVYLWAPIRILQAKNFRLVQKINVAALNSPTKLNLNEIGNCMTNILAIKTDILKRASVCNGCLLDGNSNRIHLRILVQNLFKFS